MRMATSSFDQALRINTEFTSSSVDGRWTLLLLPLLVALLMYAFV
jgi:hypothetical protein